MIAKTKQPANHQLELKFRGPLVADMQVQNYSDLTTLRYNYSHKLVWVIEHSTYYFLKTGDGSDIANWERYKQITTVLPWSPSDTYFENEIVHLNGIIYRASENIEAGVNPETNGTRWITVSGSSVTVRYMFENVPTVTIQTTIKNPVFQVMIGEFQIEEGEYVKDRHGFTKIFNGEFIDCSIEPTQVEGEYLFSFIENELPVNLTGIINIK